MSQPVENPACLTIGGRFEVGLVGNDWCPDEVLNKNAAATKPLNFTSSRSRFSSL